MRRVADEGPRWASVAAAAWAWTTGLYEADGAFETPFQSFAQLHPLLPGDRCSCVARLLSIEHHALLPATNGAPSCLRHKQPGGGRSIHGQAMIGEAASGTVAAGKPPGLALKLWQPPRAPHLTRRTIAASDRSRAARSRFGRRYTFHVASGPE